MFARDVLDILGDRLIFSTTGVQPLQHEQQQSPVVSSADVTFTSHTCRRPSRLNPKQKAAERVPSSQNSQADNCWDTNLDCGSAWKASQQSWCLSSSSHSSLHNSHANLLLPQYRHYSPGSSTGNSFIESSLDESGLLDPTLTLSAFGLQDGSDTQFSSPLQPLLPLEPENWDLGTNLDFDFPLIAPLPTLNNTNTRARPASTQNDAQKSNFDCSEVSINFSDASLIDPHLAFFSDDLAFAPVAGVYNNTMENKNANDDAAADLEAFLEDMAAGGPVNIIPVPTLSPTNATSPNSNPGSKATSPSKPAPAVPARVTKEFHFVSNSDKAGAARVRNTLASRKHRQSKVNRIAELEKLLADMEEDRDMWKQRALELSESKC